MRAALKLSPLLLLAGNAAAQVIPKISLGIDQAKSPQEASMALQVVFLLPGRCDLPLIHDDGIAAVASSESLPHVDP